MGIDAGFPIVVILSVRAPNCFKVEHIEVHVNFILFNHFNGQLGLAVRKRAKLLILTLGRLPRFEVGGAELGFVFVWVVEFFNSIVGSVTGIALGTGTNAVIKLAGTRLSGICHEWTHF